MTTENLQFQTWSTGEVTIARPIGALDTKTYPHLRDTLLKHAAEEPEAVVVDLSDLETLEAGALSVFALVSMRIADWPGVPLLLVAPTEYQRATLATTTVARFVPVHETIAGAIAVVGRPLARRRAAIELPQSPYTVRRARAFVGANCTRWHVDDLVVDALIIVTELVQNAIIHTDSTAFLRMELRSGLLSVAVSDNSPKLAVLHENAETGVPVSGLSLVSAAAQAWGCMPTLCGGKTVWATLRQGGWAGSPNSLARPPE